MQVDDHLVYEISHVVHVDLYVLCLFPLYFLCTRSLKKLRVLCLSNHDSRVVELDAQLCEKFCNHKIVNGYVEYPYIWPRLKIEQGQLVSCSTNKRDLKLD